MNNYSERLNVRLDFGIWFRVPPPYGIVFVCNILQVGFGLMSAVYLVLLYLKFPFITQWWFCYWFIILVCSWLHFN